MAAPSATVWGNIVTESTSAAKIGIHASLSSTSTQTTVTIQVWIASKWSLLDSNYTFYFNNNATSATTLISDDVLPKIDVKVATGTGWSTSNQVLLYTYTMTYDRGTSAKKINCAAKLTDINRFSGKTMTVSASYTIPALASYTVSYNANGGSGAPSAQTKYHGKTLTLSTAKPTRTGYSFLGWSTSSSATSASYSAGASFTSNATTTLYAVWKANTYTVSYNANGGTGAPGNQTKTYGDTLTLSSTKPTRTNYNFKGWGTSASSTTVAYAAGGNYTTNAAITLYAIWELAYTKPRITGLKVTRCTSNGTASEEGTYFKISFDWATDKTVSSVKVAWGSTSSTITASGTSGSVDKTLGSGNMSTESSYTITVTVADSTGSTATSKTLPGKSYTLDFLAGGKGAAFGKPAEIEGALDIEWDVNVRQSIIAQTAIIDELYDNSNGTPVQVVAAVEKVLLNASSTLSVTDSTSKVIKSWTVDESGLYAISATAYWAANATGMRALYIRVGSSDDIAYARQYSGGNANFTQNVSGYARLTKGQIVYVYGWQNSGADLTLNDYLVQIIKIGA